MKVCFYSPYVPKHFGGGEKHFFDVATLVATKHSVTVAISLDEGKSIQQIKTEYQNFLNYSLDKIEFIYSPIPTGIFLQKLLWTKNFDYFYYVTDGSLFFSLAGINNLHIQIPFVDLKLSFLDRLKLKNWKIKNTNSIFTKNIIEEKWNTHIDYVLNPKVSFQEISEGQNSEKSKKEKIILNVGRFFKHLHSKRQDVLVDIFKEMIHLHPSLMRGWKLIFVGNIEDEQYFNQVMKSAGDYPIEFHTNVSREILINHYQRSQIYWHATGFEIDEDVSPEKLEHFGIVTVEAMASGCIPIVYGKGGQIEIIGDELSNLLWTSKEECINTTIKAINGTLNIEHLGDKIFNQSSLFDEHKFAENLWKMF